MVTHTTWSEWFINHPSNDAGNCNLQAFSKTLSSGKTAATKLKQVTEDINTVILGANGSRKIMLFHSPRNFGGTRTRQENKLVCRLGMGPQAIRVLIELNSVLANCDIIVPTVDELSGCTTAQEVEDIPAPAGNIISFEGSAIYIPGSIFRNAIITSGSTTPSELIPLINTTARALEADTREAQIALNGNPVNRRRHKCLALWSPPRDHSRNKVLGPTR